MQPALPLCLAPLLHHQFQYLPLKLSQQPQQGHYLLAGHFGHVRAGEWDMTGGRASVRQACITVYVVSRIGNQFFMTNINSQSGGM